ncbi:MAG: hypothetical protein N3A00_04195 [Thermodesulfovibrio sp.]|nr:hypothetical protein [Thermodesulfovibrio sp.]
MPKALICENDPEVQKNLAMTFKTLNIESIIPLSLEEALNTLETEDIAIAIVNETFANEKPQKNKIIQWIINLPMYRRREIMLVITGENLKSLDRLLAFAKGANLVLNNKDLNNFYQFFKRAYLEYQSTYRQYKELLAK